MSWLFPRKNVAVEDLNPFVVWVARSVVVSGLAAAIWVAFCAWQLAETRHWKPTQGQVMAGDVRYALSQVTGMSFLYEVDGRKYASASLAVGGRPLGRVPDHGPVTVYYDPQLPERAVLKRRWAEGVYVAALFAAVSPFLARRLWLAYA